jgi:hypothetical protein
MSHYPQRVKSKQSIAIRYSKTRLHNWEQNEESKHGYSNDWKILKFKTATQINHYKARERNLLPYHYTKILEFMTFLSFLFGRVGRSLPRWRFLLSGGGGTSRLI